MWTARPAPAKLNLALEVLGRRQDGYHDLAAVSQSLEWGDLVAAEEGAPPAAGAEPTGWEVAVTGPEAAALAAEGGPNLVARAAAALVAAGRPPRVGRLWVCKRIPIASGLGGGSADAAATLRLLAPGLEDTLGWRIALALGSDVPFALLGGTARLGGVGEELEPLPSPSPIWCVVAVLGAVRTRLVYAAARPADHTDGERVDRLAAALRDGEPIDPAYLGSGLEAAAWRVDPGLADRARRLRSATAPLPWALTGSGGAYFSLAPDREAAAELAAAAAEVPGASVTVTRTAWAPPPAREAATG